MRSICALCMNIAFISFLGFCVENLWLAITKGYMDNRNMLFPFLFGYGLTVAAIYLVFGTPRNLVVLGKEITVANENTEILLYSLIVMTVISLGEIILGKTVEKICHIRWWDYSRLPFHITQYTSLFTSVGFTFMIVLFMDKVFVPMYEWHLSWNRLCLTVVAIATTLLMLIDFIHSAYHMFANKSIMTKWKFDFSHTRLFQKTHRTANTMKR